MEALEITATLASPLAIPLFPISLDALLAAMVCEQAGLVAGVGDWVDVDVPIQRSLCGRYHLASVGHYRADRNLNGYRIKRSPLEQYMLLGDSKIRSVQTNSGRNKSFRIPQPKAVIAGGVKWWAYESPGRDPITYDKWEAYFFRLDQSRLYCYSASWRATTWHLTLPVSGHSKAERYILPHSRL